MKNCFHCNEELRDDAKFCPSCTEKQPDIPNDAIPGNKAEEIFKKTFGLPKILDIVQFVMFTFGLILSKAIGLIGWVIFITSLVIFCYGVINDKFKTRKSLLFLIIFLHVFVWALLGAPLFNMVLIVISAVVIFLVKYFNS